MVEFIADTAVLGAANWFRFFACGMLGAFLLVAAANWINVGMDLMGRPMPQRILFIFTGGVAAFLYFLTPLSVLYIAPGVGAGWPYLVVGIQKTAKTYANGRRYERLGLDPKELIERARRQDEGDTDHAVPDREPAQNGNNDV